MKPWRLHRGLHPTRLPVGLVASALALLCLGLAGSTDGGHTWIWRGGWNARLLGAQFVHLGAAHLAANLAGLAVLAAAALRLAPGWRLAGCLMCALAAVAAGLPLPGGPAWYAGLSGALYGVFLWLALLQLRHGAHAAGLVLVLSVVSKTAIDVHAGSGAVGWLGIPVAPVAHAWGLAGGTVYFLLEGLPVWRAASTSPSRASTAQASRLPPPPPPED